ncbi:MAG: phosphoribosylformylglycinamidine cyclo-ligase [Thermodesulfobacteriota bacterium]
MEKPFSYKDAGVDIEEGEKSVDSIKPIIEETFRPEVLRGMSGFGGLFHLDHSKYNDPVLVSSTDGVGTKLKIAFAMDKHDTVGIDLVAMGVNDIVTHGAAPLFFMDYIATGKLERVKIEKIVKGIAVGCKEADCSLIGGETAEMPGFYAQEEYDLAGFAVGAIDRDKIIDGSEISVGDKVIGLASSGLHSNGFSLVRKIISDIPDLDLNTVIEGFDRSIGEELLTPTRIYIKSILNLMKEFTVKGVAHITGGGLIKNVPRILPDGCSVVINRDAWDVPLIFKFLQKEGNIPDTEMFTVFNNGIGMVVILPPDQVEEGVCMLEATGEKANIIGDVISREEGKEAVLIV